VAQGANRGPALMPLSPPYRRSRGNAFFLAARSAPRAAPARSWSRPSTMRVTPARRWRRSPRQSGGVAIRIYEVCVLSVRRRQKESAPLPRGRSEVRLEGAKDRARCCSCSQSDPVCQFGQSRRALTYSVPGELARLEFPAKTHNPKADKAYPAQGVSRDAEGE
jgi:hypothetical protein